MKKLISVFLAVLLALGLAVSAGAISVISPASDSYITDDAGVVSQDTKDYLDGRLYQLDKATGGQIAVVTVDFISGYDIEDYAYTIINDWGVGDADKNNGTVVLLVIGEENYWVTVGTGAEAFLSSYNLKSILNEYMEPDFADGDYDQAVRLTVDALISQYEGFYGVSLDGSQTAPAPSGSYDDGYYYPGGYYGGYYAPFGGLGKIVVAIIVLILFFTIINGFLMAKRRGNKQPDGKYYYGGNTYPNLFMAALIGSMFSSRRYNRRGGWGGAPPPPGAHRHDDFHDHNRRPPPGGGGFGGFGGGGFGGGGFGGGGFGGFGGGGGRGGGAGR